MSEFIGSRISLISKSDIKYVGTLHEINSETSTVALENVKSFGTEGRRGKPEEEIPPSDQTYEYIVFRGSDVKDLTIIEQAPKENKQPQMPNDPAILGSARPSQQQQQQQQQQAPPQLPQQSQGPSDHFRGPQNFPPYGGYPNQQGQQPPPQARFAPSGAPHGFPTPPGPMSGYGPPQNFGAHGPPPPGWFPPPAHGFPQPPPQGAFQLQQRQQNNHSQQHQQRQHENQGQQGQLGQQGEEGQIGNQGQQGQQGSSNPPQTQNQQASRAGSSESKQENQRPTTKQQVPSQQSGKQVAPRRNDPKPLESLANPTSSSDGLPSQTATNAEPASAEPSSQKSASRNARVAVPLATRSGVQSASQPTRAPAQSQAPSSGGQSTQNATQAAAAAVAAAMAKLGTPAGKPPGATANFETNETLAKKISELSTMDSGRGGRGGPRGNAASRGPRPPRRGGPSRHGVDVPTTDYDFESANAKFNKQDLVKEAVTTGSPLEKPTDDGGNGASVTENGHSAEDEDVVIPSAAAKRYDKSNSFFDNISSELKDRQVADSEGRRLGGSEFRTQERSRNMETFGESSPFRGRGGMRGRGRGGQRGSGRVGSDGFRGRGQSRGQADGTEA